MRAWAMSKQGAEEFTACKDTRWETEDGQELYRQVDARSD